VCLVLKLFCVGVASELGAVGGWLWLECAVKEAARYKLYNSDFWKNCSLLLYPGCASLIRWLELKILY